MINIQNSIITSSPQGKRSDNYLQRKHIYICEGNNAIYVVYPCHLLVINAFHVVYK